MPNGLRELAQDNKLCDTLIIDDDEWTQLAAVPGLHAVDKNGFLHLLITLRTLTQTPDSVDNDT